MLICHVLGVNTTKIQLKFKMPNKKRAKINLSALSYDTIRRCYLLFGLSIFFISLKLVFNSFFKSGIFFSCGKCSGPFPVLSITIKLSFIVVAIPEGVRYPPGVQYLAPYGQTLVRLAVHAIGASDTLGLLG